MRKIFYFFFLVAFFSPQWAENRVPDFSKPQTHLYYADKLSDEGDYYRAITEYKRVMYLFPDYEKLDHVKFQIGQMYYLGERYEQAKEYLVPRTASNDKPLQWNTNMFLGLTYFENREFINSVRLFGALAESGEARVSRSDLKIYEGLSYAYMKKFKEAGDTFRRAGTMVQPAQVKEYEKFFARAEKITSEGAALEKKSPGWAIFWGTVFPGGGHIYLRQYDNALVSFLLVGAATILAVDGFINASAVQSAVFLTLGTGFYVGSVYSAYRQTRKYNHTMGDSQVAALRKEMKLLNLRLSKKITF